MSVKKRLQWVHVIIIILLMFGFKYIPPVGDITSLGMQTIGIFLGVVYGWCVINLVVPSLLGLFALSLLPDTGAISTFGSAFGDRVTVALLLFFVFAELINQVGLSQWTVDWCLSRKFVKGKPFGMLAMLCLAGCIISAFVNVYASAVIMVGVFYSFCKNVGFSPGDKFPQVALVAILYTGCMAGNLFPFMGAGILLQGIQQRMAGSLPPYIPYILMQLLLMVIASVLYFAFAKFIVKPETTLIKNHELDDFNAKMNPQQKLVVGLLAAVLIALFAPSILPKEWLLTNVLIALDIAGVLAIVLVIYYVVNINSEDVVSFGRLAAGINWGVLLMLATAAPLTSAISSEDAGIMTTISNGLSSFATVLNPMVFVLIVLLIASIITQFCNNVAIILLTAPILYSFGNQFQIDAGVLSILIAFCLNVAFVTPAASASAAMVFSGKPYMDNKTAALHGLVIFIVNMLVTVVGILIMNVFM